MILEDREMFSRRIRRLNILPLSAIYDNWRTIYLWLVDWRTLYLLCAA
jgi:hypothetical protein